MARLDRTHLAAAIVGLTAGLTAGLLTGFCVGRVVPVGGVETTVERDTVIVVDTVTRHLPPAVAEERVRTVWRVLPVARTVRDTVVSAERVEMMETPRDSVAVEVPITQKRYAEEGEFEAWVSGFEPRLDSIKVYRRTERVTERVTERKKAGRWSIGVQCGYGVGLRSKTAEPYVGVGIGLRIW